jgi:hypothetical protein
VPIFHNSSNGWLTVIDDSDQAAAYDQVVNAPHKAELSHELIASAASYEAAKEYEDHCAENGKFPIPVIKATRVTCPGQPESHAKAKELLAGLAGAFIDRIVETRGLDFVDKEKAKHHAKEQLYDVSAGDY